LEPCEPCADDNDLDDMITDSTFPSVAEAMFARSLSHGQVRSPYQLNAFSLAPTTPTSPASLETRAFKSPMAAMPTFSQTELTGGSLQTTRELLDELSVDATGALMEHWKAPTDEAEDGIHISKMNDSFDGLEELERVRLRGGGG
jgi:hypothetical protein